MSACVPTHPDSARTERSHPPHSPPPPGRRPHIAGADLSAAVAVFLIALPLSLGIALATGAPLQAGLVAAAVGGLVAGRLGGSPLQVSGPAAGLTVVTADLIHRYGWRTTCAITVLAGLAQLALGCLRVARGALAVSPAVVHGMLAGIGITIAVAQLHIVLGGSPQSSVLANLLALPSQLSAPDPAALAAGALTLALLLCWPRLPGRAGRLLRTVPAALVAVAGATATVFLTGLTLPRVDLPSWRSHALAGLPEGPALGLAAAVLSTTLVCSVQSLLGAVAVDKLVAGRPGPAGRPARCDLDRELLGQGAANVVSGALGGLPVAGVAVRSSANVRAGAVSRNSTMLHGVLVVIAALLMVPVLEFIPLASLAALVMAVGVQMVSVHHIRTVTRHREVPVYAVTTLGVVALGVLQGVALGVAVAVALALHRLTRTRITHAEQKGVHHVRVRGQLTFLAVPRLSRTLHLVPHGADVTVEWDGSFMDHAAYESLRDWRRTHTAQGGSVRLIGRRSAVRGARPAGPAPAPGPSGEPTARLLITCADSRLSPSVPAAGGPGDLFVVRNVGNLVPLPGQERGDDSVAAGIEYAVDVLGVRSITVCGHSGCGAMQVLLDSGAAPRSGPDAESGPGPGPGHRSSPDAGPDPGSGSGTGARARSGFGDGSTPLGRWLRHGAPSLERMAGEGGTGSPSLDGRRPADPVEQLCLTNIVQQLEHLRAHDAVARALRDGTLELHGLYVHAAGAQTYLLTVTTEDGTGGEVFLPVGAATSQPATATEEINEARQTEDTRGAEGAASAKGLSGPG